MTKMRDGFFTFDSWLCTDIIYPGRDVFKKLIVWIKQ